MWSEQSSLTDFTSFRGISKDVLGSGNYVAVFVGELLFYLNVVIHMFVGSSKDFFLHSLRGFEFLVVAGLLVSSVNLGS